MVTRRSHLTNLRVASDAGESGGDFDDGSLCTFAMTDGATRAYAYLRDGAWPGTIAFSWIPLPKLPRCSYTTVVRVACGDLKNCRQIRFEVVAVSPRPADAEGGDARAHGRCSTQRRS
jgi:hypothetical protein